MDVEALDNCYVATIGGDINQIDLTVYIAPGGWRWLAHDIITGSRTGDAAQSAEQAKEAAEQFARKRIPGDYTVQWNMAFVRRQAG